jgi:hypothetical protein
MTDVAHCRRDGLEPGGQTEYFNNSVEKRFEHKGPLLSEHSGKSVFAMDYPKILLKVSGNL